ncbi:hypothetical protein MTO96_018867 [Rhipicephalus appendiculatus]
MAGTRLTTSAVFLPYIRVRVQLSHFDRSGENAAVAVLTALAPPASFSAVTDDCLARRGPYFAPRVLERTPTGRLFAETSPQNPGARLGRGWPEADRAGRSDAFKASRQRAALRDALSAPGGEEDDAIVSRLARSCARQRRVFNKRSVAAAGTMSKRASSSKRPDA